VEKHANIHEPHLDVSSLSIWAAPAVAQFLELQGTERTEFLYRSVPVRVSSGASQFRCESVPVRVSFGAGQFRCRSVLVEVSSNAGQFLCGSVTV
jgi:pyrrolidone-carboxylate peptidase